MLRAAALAIVVLLSSGGTARAAQAPVTEITMADCHEGYESPPGSPLLALVLTPDGRALRASAPLRPDGRGGAPIVFESADIGVPAYRALAHQIETSSFFELSAARTGTVVTDTRGTRISAVRAARRMTWASDNRPTDRGEMIDAVRGALLAHSRDSHLTWRAAPATTDPFAICDQPMQDLFRHPSRTEET